MTLLTRRPIVERDFDVDPGWLGPRFLDDFWRLRSAHRRLETARSARGGGSMPRWMCRRLRSAIDAGQLTHAVGEVEHAAIIGEAVEVSVAGRVVSADRGWLATGTRTDATADDALAALVDQHIDGVPIVDCDLRVGDLGLFVTGRLATIELGPAAGNLWGARMAARRIGRAITGIDLDTDEAAAIPPPPLAVASQPISSLSVPETGNEREEIGWLADGRASIGVPVRARCWAVRSSPHPTGRGSASDERQRRDTVRSAAATISEVDRVGVVTCRGDEELT